MGSIISFIGVILFICILMERISVCRCVISGNYSSTSLEWVCGERVVPLDFHGSEQVLVVFGCD